MPRSLYQLEGQQLLRLRELAEKGFAWPGLSATHPNREIMTIIDQLLADGPQVRDAELPDGATEAEPMAVDVECTLCQEPIKAGEVFWLDVDDHPSHTECWEAELADAANMQRYVGMSARDF